jgi:hypothetical protein
MGITIFCDESKTSIYVKDLVTCEVIKDIARRAEVGLAKYKTTLEDNKTDDFDNHLYEELLDAAQYLKKKKRSKEES